jgi:DNA (cytosine-5)-methyltransferase 3A
MNVLSLFDGMSCGMIALERAGLSVKAYYAAEIDKHANYPTITRLGSVLGVKGENLPKIDLLIGGSPCQGFSFAGRATKFRRSAQ